MLTDTPGPGGDGTADPDEKALSEFLDAAFARYARGEPVVPAQLVAPHLVARAGQLLADAEELFAAAVGVQAASRELDPPPDDPFPGEFRVVRVLGEGSFGRVLLAEDVNLGRQVALKVIRPGDPASAARRLGLLRAEAKLVAAVRHPNVVDVYACRDAPDPAGPVPVLVLRYVPGGSLADRVKRDGPLPWAAAARYVADVADGLAAVHAAGVVHRDVKPGNILWDPATDEAVLTDFGISTRLTDGPPAGTMPYMPPEAFDGRGGPGQDVYALAASLFWLLTGEPPFPGRTAGEQAEQARRGLSASDPRFAATPARVERLIRRGLAADPAARPPLADFARDLRGALNQSLADALASTPADAGPGPRVTVSRRAGEAYAPLATSRAESGTLVRDLKKVPAEPDRATAHTGERVRVEVEAPAAGFLTVFNVGPTGNLNVLFPEAGPGDVYAPAAVAGGVPVRILDLALTPPAGDERIVAVWSPDAVPFRSEELVGLTGGWAAPAAYRATRDIKKLEQPADGDRRVTVLTLRHLPAGGS